jgi:hypothetical protein
LQRRVQKLASAAKISFAKQSLLQDHNRLLYRINSEAKVRRSTRSLVIGKAKVMSYEDLDEARVARAAKDKAASEKGKAKRGRKRKASTREVEEAISQEEVAGPSVPKMARHDVQESAPWTAPVAL